MKISSIIAGLLAASAIVGTASIGYAAAAGGIGGKVTLPLTITFLTAPASTFQSQYSSLSCSMTLTSDDVLAPADTVTVPIKISGTTGTCNLTINYLWHVINPKSHMTISFAITGNAVSSTLQPIISRLSSGGVEKKVLPANGAATAYRGFKVVL